MGAHARFLVGGASGTGRGRDWGVVMLWVGPPSGIYQGLVLPGDLARSRVFLEGGVF